MDNNKHTKNKGLAALTTNPVNLRDVNKTSTNNQHKVIFSSFVIKPQNTVDLHHKNVIFDLAPHIFKLHCLGLEGHKVTVREEKPHNISHKGVTKNVLRGTK